MDHATDLQSWSTFFLAVAGASAALTGLLVVGLSINLAAIARDAALRAHARTILGVLTVILVLCLVGIIPQSAAVTAWEFLAVGAIFAAVNAANNYSTFEQLGWRISAAGWRRTLAAHAISAAALIGGISLALGDGVGGGLYWIALSIVGGLVWSVAGAWRFLIGVADERAAESGRHVAEADRHVASVDQRGSGPG